VGTIVRTMSVRI